MKKHIIYKVSAFLCGILFALNINAQQVNTQYFLENVPTRHFLNPAFQPTSNVYISLPIIGYTQFGVTNNSLSLSNVLQNKDGKTVLLSDRYSMYKGIRNTTTLRADLHTNLLGFGFRTSNAYWTFSLSEKVDGQLHLPKDVFKLLVYGNPPNDNSFDLKSLGFDVSAYTEAALGYSREINEQWTVGGKLKFLYGTANMSTENNSLKLDAGIDKWRIKGSGVLNISSPAEEVLDEEDKFDPQFPDEVGEWFKPAGLGMGIDLGATYKPIDELTLSVALTDLGFIRWSRNSKNMTYEIDYEFDGLISEDQDLNDVKFDQLMDSILTALEDNATYSTKGTNPFTTSTSPKLNIGAEYGFFDHKLSVGLLSRTMLHKSKLYEELTTSVNGRPIDWFNMSLSYSLLNGRFATIGAGIGLRTGILNWYWSADYVSLNNARLQIDDFPIDIPVPYKAKGLNFAFGLSLVFGNKQDKDRDGVRDKYDLCPKTPKNVQVDANGCPIDSDGDGVPDYLDHCPDTPKEAYGFVDEYGCPLDTDGDGVPDYLDKCPDTPEEAHLTVDKDGCPVDSDGDGIPDYLDECPDTPIQARGMVDEYGCPLDSDGDGIPDYLDHCPKIPGSEENNGCPEIGQEVQDILQKALHGIQFEQGEDVVILESSNEILDQIVWIMEEYSFYKIEIQGHTDNIGKKEANQILSEKRAGEVKKYLTDKGIVESRITAVGYGDSQPMAPNEFVTGREKNHRIQFIISFDEEAYDENVGNEEPSVEEIIIEENTDEGAVDEEALDEEIVTEETADEEALDEEIITEETVDEETSNKETVTEEVSGEEIVE